MQILLDVRAARAISQGLHRVSYLMANPEAVYKLKALLKIEANKSVNI